MSIQTRPFGHMPDGEPVTEYILTNGNGLTATFLDLGGIWRQMLVPDREGRMEDVVLGYDTVEAYLADTYNFGALVGRNANRIGGASLELNGVTYHLAVNSGLRDNLHSGPELYGRRKWRAEQVALEGAEGLQFSLSSPDGDQGYPGNAEIRVTYALREDNAPRLFQPGRPRRPVRHGTGGLDRRQTVLSHRSVQHPHRGAGAGAGDAYGFHPLQAHRTGYRCVL